MLQSFCEKQKGFPLQSLTQILLSKISVVISLNAIQFIIQIVDCNY